MEIYAINIENADFLLCQYLSRHVSEELRNKLQRYRFKDDFIRSLFGEVLVRIVAFDHWNISHHQVKIVRNEYSKPALLGYPNYHFNISHSSDWVVACFDISPVGIDIERIRPFDLAIANRFFSRLEIEHMYKQPVNQRLSCFYDFWTLKESYIKAVGKGLSIALHSFSFFLEGKDIKLNAGTEMDTWCFRMYELDSGYKMAVCGNPLRFPEKIHILPWTKASDQFERIINA
ncbi:4'-phosphopantetheinyl transferase superfamily protein [Paenibacillus sp. 2TAB23]|uniref:4'-phosphopantetheinyl transferase family protein n=1 Tax=Paenibacillus sp. 2TAB23 TaxID=3233004 RepID=UPI003F996701